MTPNLQTRKPPKSNLVLCCRFQQTKGISQSKQVELQSVRMQEQHNIKE